MFIITGNKDKVIQFIYKKLLNKKVPDSDYIQDIKSIYYKGQIIVIVPEFNNYIATLKKCQHLINDPINLLIIFNTDSIKSKELDALEKYCQGESIDIVTDEIGKYNSENISIMDENEITQCMNAICQNKEPITSTSCMLLGITNVGKSSLINKMIGEGVLRVKDERHTTQSITQCLLSLDNENISLYDSYGIERKIKNKLANAHKIIEKINRCFIVTDIYTYNQKINLYMCAFLDSLKSNYSIIINKIDLADKYRMSEINDFISRKLNNKGVYFTSSTYDDNHPKSFRNTVKKILSDKVRRLDSHKINKLVKDEFQGVLYIRQINTDRIQHYKFIVMAKKNARTLNESLMQKFISKHFGIVNNYIDIKIIALKKEDVKKVQRKIATGQPAIDYRYKPNKSRDPKRKPKKSADKVQKRDR